MSIWKKHADHSTSIYTLKTTTFKQQQQQQNGEKKKPFQNVGQISDVISSGHFDFGENLKKKEHFPDGILQCLGSL